MTAPTVSVIMAAYNGAAFLPATIASLQAQTFTDFEVVIVDDRSTDDTRAVLAAIDDPRFRIVESPINQGPVRTRNHAVVQARGRYLAGLDQDDLCRPDRLRAQVAYLDAHPDTVLLGTAAAYLDDDVINPAVRTAHTTPALIEWLLLIENPLVWSSVMLRADAIGDPFTDPDRLYAEDFDLYHRMARRGRIARLDTPLVLYRRHEGGASQRYTETMYANAAAVLAGAYAEPFGDQADDIAGLVIRHMMAQLPVPDGATLRRLGDALARLQAHFFAQRPIGAEDRKLIRWETARRWGHTSRCALRSGTIGLHDAITARPDHLGLGHTGFEDLALSRLIGGARAVKRRYSR
ncbi:glycosyltransferase family 2 protein [Sphingomonas hylomeconis]|uniref:Glycosyltransferase family 2 protein n=1 Tax=Sphingomonas hylomeconis TaxID=1395958 RepID=A0ABV7SSQ9_9SPHN|nr:glycosyltransferase [Sphingomonas hylomeconis]